MEIRHLRLTTFKLVLIILLASMFICHGEIVGAIPRVVFINRPPANIKVLSGSSVDFTWKFRVIEPRMIKGLSWFLIVSNDNWRNNHKIIEFRVNSSVAIIANPNLNQVKSSRANCTFHFHNQIWSASCRLMNATTYDSASYGMKVEFCDGKNTVDANTSSLKVIDIVLDDKKSDHVVESWIGNPTVLKCTILRNLQNPTTRYKWNVVSDAKDITRGTTRRGNNIFYTFVPTSERDFAIYKCTVSTATTTVEHEILLKQIHYAGPPEGLRVEDPDGDRFLSLFWNQPKTNGGTKIISYEIIVTGDDNHKIRKTTTKLSAGVRLPDNNRYEIRVCSVNKIGKTDNSCTTPHEIRIAQLPQKGRTERLESHLLHTFAAIILVYWII